MPEESELTVRDRFAEFVALRKKAIAQGSGKFTGHGSTTVTGEPTQFGGPMRIPPWIRALEEFTELEQTIQAKIDALAESQRAFLRPKFLSDEEEEKMRAAIDTQTAAAQALIKELDRMVINGMAPRDPTHSEEVHTSANARKHLSTRLKALLTTFKSRQEYYGNQLRQRERKQQKYQMFGNEESHQKVKQESQAAGFMEMGYTEADIQELLLEEAKSEEVSKEIKEILTSIQDLHAMFEELHTLVAEQGTILDRIDYNIQEAERGVVKGHKELLKAREHQEFGNCSIM